MGQGPERVAHGVLDQTLVGVSEHNLLEGRILLGLRGQDAFHQCLAVCVPAGDIDDLFATHGHRIGPRNVGKLAALRLGRLHGLKCVHGRGVGDTIDGDWVSLLEDCHADGYRTTGTSTGWREDMAEAT